MEERGQGLYLGTEIDEKWWKRYKNDNMFSRGNGEYWFSHEGLHFLRYLTKEPIFIPFSLIRELKIGTWHSGTWSMGAPVLKIIWEKDGQRLCSGYILSKKRKETEEIKAGIEKEINEK